MTHFRHKIIISHSLLQWWKFENTQYAAYAFYQVQCCLNCTKINCTIHVYLVSLTPLPPIQSISILCNIAWQSWCNYLFTKKTIQFQLAIVADPPRETFIQLHLAEALCNLVAWSPLKIDGAPPVACLCIPETVGRPRPRTERGTRNRKRKQLPQYSCCWRTNP